MLTNTHLNLHSLPLSDFAAPAIDPASFAAGQSYYNPVAQTGYRILDVRGRFVTAEILFDGEFEVETFPAESLAKDIQADGCTLG